jgi:hypothetical protein
MNDQPGPQIPEESNAENNTPQSGNSPAVTSEFKYLAALQSKTDYDLNSLPPTVQMLLDQLQQDKAELSRENAKRRNDMKKAEETLLTEQQQWKLLAEKRGEELKRLEELQGKAETIEAAFNAQIDARLKAIPQEIRKRTVDPIRERLSPLEFAQWLDANQDVLSVRRAPNLDAGTNNAGGGSVHGLSPEQVAQARALGIPLEKYAETIKKK